MAIGKALDINIFKQFVALLYKELLLRKCHYIATSFGVIFPIIIASIPCILYNRVTVDKSEKRKEFQWVNFTTFEPVKALNFDSGYITDNLEFVYASSNEMTDLFMEDSVRAFFGISSENRVKFPKKMNSEEELRKYILEEQKMDEYKAIIGTVFKGFGDTLPKDLDYKIYFTRTFDTGKKYALNGPDDSSGYRYSYLVKWQAAVGDTFIRQKSIERKKIIDYEARRYWSMGDITKRADPICMESQFRMFPDAAMMPQIKHS
ncbi:hypothetical protein AVEN_176058-1 [Araneus ventricosus]|uniref:Uncharacterized protein n=1 Tax=Araneus ventricosus TaxID=182803 RepID=A0A4Y2F4C3_ARAVE|nr:hypothetical protein AVEN_176058-1 [Araneus ventricosus]